MEVAIKEGAKIPEPKWERYLLDLLTYAHRNYPRNVLMINGIFENNGERKGNYCGSARDKKIGE